MPYFVRRRSEEQARQTKQHLERKWGVEFPNTGFCNFVKFSVIRHVNMDWADLPPRQVFLHGDQLNYYHPMPSHLLHNKLYLRVYITFRCLAIYHAFLYITLLLFLYLTLSLSPYVSPDPAFVNLTQQKWV